MDQYFDIQGVFPWHGFSKVIGSDPWQAGADPGAKGYVSSTCGNARDNGNVFLTIPYNSIPYETPVFPSLDGGLKPAFGQPGKWQSLSLTRIYFLCCVFSSVCT